MKRTILSIMAFLGLLVGFQHYVRAEAPIIEQKQVETTPLPLPTGSADPSPTATPVPIGVSVTVPEHQKATPEPTIDPWEDGGADCEAYKAEWSAKGVEVISCNPLRVSIP